MSKSKRCIKKIEFNVALTRKIIFVILTLHFLWCGTQAVRDWSAKPSLVGSTPIHTCETLKKNPSREFGFISLEKKRSF